MVKTSFLFAAVATTFAALTQTVLAESDVLSLTEKTFDESVLNQDLMLVEFYAPWCGYCKALAPEYEIAATTLKESKIPVAKVDCTVDESLCQKQNVMSFPTLKVFRNGKTSEYRGARKADDIIKYMNKQALPPVTQVSASNFEELKKADRVVFVAYTEESDDASKEVFNALAEKNREYFVFGQITDAQLAKEHGIKELPAIVAYAQFDDNSVSSKSGEFKQSDLQEFIAIHSVPLLDEINGDNFQTYSSVGLPIAYLFHNTTESRDEIVKAAQPLAEKYQGKVIFVHIDATKYGGHTENVGLKPSYPAFAIQHMDTGAKYPLDQSLTVDQANLDDFLETYVSGKMKPLIKTAEPPVENNGPVKTVVSSQFKDIVLDKSKDVFIEVYAPWCGHCKNLEPIWTQLGQHVAESSESVMIAKMDGTENDIPEEGGFSVTSFPTLKFFKAETNELIDYDGDRSMEDLVSFLNKHNSKAIEFTVPEAKKEEAEEKTEEKTEEKKTEGSHDEL